MFSRLPRRHLQRGTHEAINAPNACPRPAGIGRLPATWSIAVAGPEGWVKTLDTASLSLRLSVSRYDPSCTSVTGAAVAAATGAGDARLNVLRDSILRGRAARSKLIPDSGRKGRLGAGDVGRLVGRKNDGFLSVSECIL